MPFVGHFSASSAMGKALLYARLAMDVHWGKQLSATASLIQIREASKFAQ